MKPESSFGVMVDLQSLECILQVADSTTRLLLEVLGLM
jgi:hypothetical protein